MAVRQATELARLGRMREADALCRKILGVAPNHFDTLHLLSHVCHRAGRLAEAIAFGRKALNQRPHSVDAMLTLGNALAAQGRIAEAIARYEKALSLDPRHPGALNNLGAVLQADYRYEEAASRYEQAIGGNPKDGKLENNLGSCLLAMQRPAAAIEHYRRAQALAPDYAMAHYNEGTALLLAGDYLAGWQKYEWRWSVPELGPSPHERTRSLWLGDGDVSGKTILLWSEQGQGDTIQFGRYAPLLVERGARVILLVKPSLLSLMKTLAGPVEVLAAGEELPAYDLQCPLMSLPHAFRTTLDTIPNRVPYLAPDAAKAARWMQRLLALPGRRVGLVWFGGSPLGMSAINNGDPQRSIPFSLMAPLAGVAGVSFVSLQLGTPALGTAPTPTGLKLHDWTAEIQDFSDTAALVDGLDLVISVDTSTAHLAGALGKPIWLMNRFDTCWRWMLDRDDSPWYPTLRQFRQPRPGDWGAVIAAIRGALAALPC
jgi:Flp pilus assembly protein TadD